MSVKYFHDFAGRLYLTGKKGEKKVIVAGTCAWIDVKYKPLDIIMPNRAFQRDCTVKEQQPLILRKF